MSAIRAAFDMIDQDRYVTGPDGELLAQTTSPATIDRLLGELGVQPGDRILEVGTGSGLTAALLAELVGPTGQVTTIDVNPSLTHRAHRLLQDDGYAATVVTGDARRLPPTVKQTQYDRMIAWTTAQAIPHPWVAAILAGGRMVVPVELAPVGHAAAVAVLDRTAVGVAGVRFVPGTFVPIHTLEASPVPGLPAHVNAHSPDSARWLSAAWLPYEPARAAGLLELITERWRETGPLVKPDEPVGQFALWLCAQRPVRRLLTTARLSDGRVYVGASSRQGALLLPLDGYAPVAAGDTSVARPQLSAWLGPWRAEGRPPLGTLAPLPLRRASHWLIDARHTRRVAAGSGAPT